MSKVGAPLTVPELGRMKLKLTNPESPYFSGESVNMESTLFLRR
ncbi:MAG: hypothetical protein ACTSYT_03405 [Candidatus Asgardarchaeia archaeon]